MSRGNLPESLSQAMLVGIMLVGGLGVSHGSGILAPQLVVLWIECTRADPTPDPQPQSEHLESNVLGLDPSRFASRRGDIRDRCGLADWA